MKPYSPVYGITDAGLMQDQQLLTKVEAALQGGCLWIQYRDKSNDHRRRQREASQLAQLCTRYNGKLIVNDDLELALSSGAHGVHLGREDMPIEEARSRVSSRFIIGATCHSSLDLAHHAARQGASYIAFGRFFSSTTKPEATTATLEILRAAREIFTIPVVAIGGLTLANAPAVVEAGADIVAVCQGLFGADNVTERAESFRAIMADSL